MVATSIVRNWRPRAWLWLAAFALLLTACLPEGMRVPESPLLRTLERKSGLIAYVGIDGNIYTVDQAGGRQQQVTEDADVEAKGPDRRVYQFPTWAPDSQRLAFVGVSGEGSDVDEASLLVAEPDGQALTETFSSKVEYPFYLYWSPDSERISFLTTAASGNNLVLQLVPTDGGPSQILDTGQPYYWDWAPDGKRMLVHVGGGTSGRLAFLTPNNRVVEEGLGLSPTTFQAPAWSPNGEQLLVAADTGNDRQVLFLADQLGRLQESLIEYEGSIAFAWSPDNRQVGYIVSEQPTVIGGLGKLQILDLEDQSQVIESEQGLVVAFFWSPDGRRVAYFVPALLSPQAEDGSQQGQTLVLAVYVLDARSGDSQRVAVFVPTEQFLGMLPYFDQYQRSATIWSPDSRLLVLSGYLNEREPTIWVAPASGNIEPRSIASGVLAFWSWN